MSKKKTPKKPRSKFVQFDFGKEVTINSISYDPTTGEAKLFHDGEQKFPVRAWVEHSYERPKGRKVLARADVSPKSTVSDVNLVLGSYHEIFAADTNTKIIRGNTVSVCGIVGGKAVPGPQGVICQYGPIQCTEYRGVTESAEKIGWVETIQAMCASPTFSTSRLYGLIVDAYLGELESFNDRSQAILGGYYLPNNVSLVYASSDVPNETLANRMLSLADDMANIILSGLEMDTQDWPLELVENKPYSARRYWRRMA